MLKFMLGQREARDGTFKSLNKQVLLEGMSLLEAAPKDKDSPYLGHIISELFGYITMCFQYEKDLITRFGNM